MSAYGADGRRFESCSGCFCLVEIVARGRCAGLIVVENGPRFFKVGNVIINTSMMKQYRAGMSTLYSDRKS